MPFSFPSNPSIGATSTQNGREYRYAGGNVWELAASGGGSAALRTFSVTNSGSGAYLIDGSSNSTLTLERGQTYDFVVNASGHPFHFQTVPQPYSLGNLYTTGVTNGGTASGTIRFVVPYDAPATLYYVCQFHGSMGGTVNVVSANEDLILRSLFTPSAPTGLTATAGNAQATLSWTAPTGVISQAPVSDYREQYSTDGGTTWTTFTAAASTAASSTITGLANSTAYVFRVAGVNAAGVGAYSTASSAVTPAAGTPPGAPTGLAATAGNAQIALSWTAPASAGSSAITGYTVEYTRSGGSAQTVSTGSTGTSYTLTGLINGTSYTARVAAVNSAGTGTYTASSSPVTPTSAVFRAIPTLTSNTSDGTASANTSGGGAAWNLFDKTTSEYYTYRNGFDTPKRYFEYSFAGGEKSYIGGYSMTAVSSPSTSIYSWELSGSNDGANFTLIDTQSTSWSSGGQTKTFTLASPANYSTYRWTLTPDSTNDTFAGLREVQLTAESSSVTPVGTLLAISGSDAGNWTGTGTSASKFTRASAISRSGCSEVFPFVFEALANTTFRASGSTTDDSGDGDDNMQIQIWNSALSSVVSTLFDGKGSFNVTASISAGQKVRWRKSCNSSGNHSLNGGVTVWAE